MRRWVLGLAAAMGLVGSAGLFAEESKTLKIYGGFELDKLDGWEVKGKSPLISVDLATENPRSGKKCLRVAGEGFKYQSALVTIDPVITWDPKEDCLVTFSLKSDNNSAGALGYYFAVLLQGKDPAGKEYSFYLFPFLAGDKQFEAMKKGQRVWNDQDNLTGPPIRQTALTYNQLLPGFQASNWRPHINRWVDFKVNLKEAFGAPGAPPAPPSIKFTSLTAGGYTHDRIHWQLDDVMVETGPAAATKPAAPAKE